MLPKYIKPFLWSYDANRLDREKDKQIIITNILNYGSQRAVIWLFKTYPENEIRNFVVHPSPGKWSKKSLNYWSLLLGVKPEVKIRRIK
ncbi:MAG: hypothetical protein Q8M56_04400 [Desulfobacterales bacterium]|jgi:hypothetical protein|nr:hypothetical protein [Desulfobacterales bacterium]